jgi:hypothetical protein
MMPPTVPRWLPRIPGDFVAIRKSAHPIARSPARREEQGEGALADALRRAGLAEKRSSNRRLANRSPLKRCPIEIANSATFESLRPAAPSS